MIKLDRLLQLPPPAIALLSVVGLLPISPFRTFGDDHSFASVTPFYSPALISSLALLVWMYALYDASIARVASGQPRSGKVFWLLLVGAWTAAIALAHTLYIWDGNPPQTLLTAYAVVGVPAVIGAFVALLKATNAFAKFERSAVPPDEKAPWNPLLPLLFITIGIWFLNGRIQRMLTHPRLV